LLLGLQHKFHRLLMMEKGKNISLFRIFEEKFNFF